MRVARESTDLTSAALDALLASESRCAAISGEEAVSMFPSSIGL